ncbi:Maf family protein [Polycladidibacter stylochi]|uniref:Maf family protein n=1 Tax=Polycladidibacter stylochi TaxID=1807766 RepID=UPI00082A398B|nr:Maf family protein [Pseudovibrio stylochi]
MSNLVLASGSQIRATLLKNAGLTLTIDPADIDERSLEAKLSEKGASPEEIALELAKEKAIHVSKRQPQQLVIGADQVLSFEDIRLNKPKNMAEAQQRLRDFSGKSHQLHSAICVALNGTSLFQATSTANLFVRKLEEAFLDWYMHNSGESILQSVGAYQLEGIGIQLFEKIEGDYFTILGLPLLQLLNFLRSEGHLKT